MPKKRKYPWYAARECYRVQRSLPDRSVRTLYAKTEAEMDAKLAELEKEIAAGVDAKINPTVAQYAARWFPLRTSGLSPARKEDYRNAINIHIGPYIADKKMKEVTSTDGREIMAALAERSSSLQANVVCVLKGMFEDAEEEGLIVKSPFRRLKAAGKPPEEKEPLTDDQAERLVQAVRGTAAEPFVMLCLYAGLRREEALGLRWRNVRLSGPAPYIAVRERVTFDKGQAVHEEELKSKAARRNLPIPDPLLWCLRSWRIQNPHEFVVPNSKGGPRSRQSFRRLWEIIDTRTIHEGQEAGEKIPKHKITRTLDFKVSPHQLRHTYITNLCRGGVNIKTVQYLAGHATASLTLKIYIHATENRPEDLLDKLNHVFRVVEKDTTQDTGKEKKLISIEPQRLYVF